MPPTRRTAGFWCIAFGVSLSACASSGEQVVGPTSASVGRAEVIEGPVGLDATFLRISEIDSDFAGFWIDVSTGEMVVSSVRGSDDQVAAGAVRQVFAGHPRFRRSEPMRIEHAEYRFVDLQRWRLVVEQQMVKLGLTFIDVDERANRILVGARHDISQAQLLEAIGQMGVPLAAVTLSVREELMPMALLTDKRRPVENGFQVSFPVGAGQYGQCSHGGDVLVPNGKGFVTAGHCNLGGFVGNTGATIYQSLGGGTNAVGTIISNPPAFTGGACPTGAYCRYSDAEVVKYSNTSYYSGKKVAISSVIGTLAAGSLTLGSIVTAATSSNLFTGLTVMRTGKTSGTTSGPVTQTCVTILAGGLTLLCQDEVNAYAGHGDSGGPVFWQYEADWYHIGIAVAIDSAATLYYESPWIGVAYDTGIFY